MIRKKKKWTTKNTHLKKKEEKDSFPKKNGIYDKIDMIVWLAIALLVIILIALNNHVVGYDNFIGIPRNWVYSLFD